MKSWKMPKLHAQQRTKLSKKYWVLLIFLFNSSITAAHAVHLPSWIYLKSCLTCFILVPARTRDLPLLSCKSLGRDLKENMVRLPVLWAAHKELNHVWLTEEFNHVWLRHWMNTGRCERLSQHRWNLNTPCSSQIVSSETQLYIKEHQSFSTVVFPNKCQPLHGFQ